MVARKFIWNTGQSNGGPWHDDESWMADRADLNLLVSTRRVAGSTDTLFTVPGSIPGFTTAVDLKGLCIRTVRYFVLYNPCATGYETYPGMTRVAPLGSLPNGLTHSSTDIYVDKRFKTGSNGVASVFRRATQTTHTISSVVEMTRTFVDGNVDPVTNEITLSTAGQAFAVGNRVRFMSTGSLPAGLSPLTVYFLKTVGSTITLSATSGGATLDLTAAAGSGTHTILHAYSIATEPATIGARITVSPAFDPVPVGGEELTYTHTANSGGSTTTTVLSQHYGLLRTGDLRGLRIRCITGHADNVGLSKNISGWNDATRTATHAAFPQSTSSGDTFAIEPLNGVAFDRFGLWLPWCPFERDLNKNLVFGELSKVNPYPPGFDYPSHWHLPQIYGASNQPVEEVSGLNLTIGHSVAWHIGAAVRLAEQLGEEVWVLSSDFGGSSTAHREFELGTRALAWYDPAQQTDWAMSRPNGCFARALVELDAAIAAAAASGSDTLSLVCLFRTQGDGDASSGVHGYSSGGFAAPEAWLTKFLDSNRAFRARLRTEIKNRGIWPKDAAKIPWVQPVVSSNTSDQIENIDGSLSTVDIVNIGLRQLADEDRYAETFETSDVPIGPDGIHYVGSGLDIIEKRAIGAYNSIVAATDQSGEVELVNVALSHLGEAGSVTSIDPVDGTFLAQIAATFYPRARRAVLELHNWQFATSRHELSKLSSDGTTTWRFAYVAPSDMLRAISVLPPDANDDYMQVGPTTDAGSSFVGYVTNSGARGSSFNQYATGSITTTNSPATQPFNIERRNDGTRIIHTNQDEAHLRYVRDVYDTRVYSELFAQAVTWKLAAMLSGPILKGQAGQQSEDRCMKMMQWYIAKARETDGAQRNVKPDPGMPFSRG